MRFRTLTLLIVLLLAGCRLSSEDAQDPDASSILFANVQDNETRYVGDAACASCHAEEFAGFQEHGMAKSFYAVTSDNRPEDFDTAPIYHEATDFYYRPISTDDGYYQEEYRVNSEGVMIHRLTRKMDYVVGSGGAAFTYLTSDNGRLYELPLTWYTQKKRWDFSPGYENTNLRFERLIPDRCMACHNSYPDDIANIEGKFASLPQGIGCERCHGPGELHVNERLSDPDLATDVDTTIVNPAHLDLSRRLDVCQQCHLNGSVDVLRAGRDAFSFRPSERLSDHVAMFISRDLQEEGIEVISHADRMKQSECFLQTIDSGSPLECTTCHNPHDGFRDKGFQYFTATCISCHSTESLLKGKSADFAVSHSSDTNCISCHMPRQEAIDVPHASFTDHFIRVPSGPADSAEGVPEALTSRQVAMQALFDRDRSSEGDIYRGMALITHGRQRGDQGPIRDGIEVLESSLDGGGGFPSAYFILGLGYLYEGSVGSAIEPLEEAVRIDPDDPEKLNALAQAYEADGRGRQVIERLYLRAMEIQPMAADIRLNYGRFLLSLGDIAAAAREFELVVEERPSFAEGYYNLATTNLQAGEEVAALGQLHHALDINPDHIEAIGNLGFLHATSGRTDSARFYFEKAAAVGASNAIAQANLGAFYLNEGDRREAIEVLKRAVELDNRFADALANLSLAYFQEDSLEAAEIYARRAIAAAPDHALANQILQALE